MYYKSTRGDKNLITSSLAIIKGIAEDGGLYVPDNIPEIDKSIDELKNMNYKQLCFYILKKFLTDFEDEELIDCIERAYDKKFNKQSIISLSRCDNMNFLELYHGPTLAFKDMALSLLPHILKVSMKKNNIDKEVVILTATSGDTGKAALEAFSKVEGTKIIVFYPENGVSDIQKMQMVTQEGDNTFVCAVKGNFDDAQGKVKDIFNDRDFNDYLNKNGYILSSANSINIGRLLPQIVYYFYGYLELLRRNEITSQDSINIVVPTGNFGNILAAYYAKRMGLKINKLICASNENNVLYDFFKTGIYDIKRNFKLTNSPSMDILISSNLERLLYEISGRDDKVVKSLMESLSKEKEYEINDRMKQSLLEFYSGFAMEDEVLYSIHEIYKSYKYLMDTHTAVACDVYKKYVKDTFDLRKTIIASTASPYKFGKSVLKALKVNAENIDEFNTLELLSKVTEIEVPKNIKELKNKEIIHELFCDKNEMKDVVKRFLGVE
ncbi:threonine synthase [Caloramator quimbayensis]|uniref:Threonine synthase n=1 Tax=Caloramator quimbayensis TaxID=1147123 RepID=A0A1T4XIJ7_9CLOT|nr:threonine synthase [Caloramator quimbayensis]SKA88925.1 threonine synthase [Caloramator quimbayensis]